MFNYQNGEFSYKLKETFTINKLTKSKMTPLCRQK